MSKGRNDVSDLVDLGTFTFDPRERERFRTGTLRKQWAEKYPMLFDERDRRPPKAQAVHCYHFFEWLGAIHLYEKKGYLSLVEKYQFKTHGHKQEVVKGLRIPGFEDLMKRRRDKPRTMCPDLLVYKSDFSDWFFCEVKGPDDQLREKQLDFFRTLADVTTKAVRLLTFREGHR